MTPKLLELLLAVLNADEGCRKKFLGREEELFSAAASMLLAMKGGGGVGQMESSVAAHTSPYSQDVADVESNVEKFRLPQTYSPDERAQIDSGHAYVKSFHDSEDNLQPIRLGHRLATADYCDTGQQILMRGKFEVRATPLELIAYWMGFAEVYAAHEEQDMAIKSGERR